MRLRIVAAVAVGIATLAVLMAWRSFPWQLALMVGTGASVLVYTTTGTVERLRDIYRGR